MGLVQQRTPRVLRLKSLHLRMTGQSLATTASRTLEMQKLVGKFRDPHDKLIAREQGELIRQLSGSMRRIEKAALAGRSPESSCERVKSLPGVGVILGLTIALESGDMNQFASAGDFASYSRCVKSERPSNGKSKGRSDARAGNGYLGWAWVETANFVRPFDPACRQFFDRKLAQTNRALGAKALACTLSKTAWPLSSMGRSMTPSGCSLGNRRHELNLGSEVGNRKWGLAQSFQDLMGNRLAPQATDWLQNGFDGVIRPCRESA